MEITSGIHQIHGIRGANCYLVTGARMLVIDTGMPGNGSKIINYIKGLGRNPSDIDYGVIRRASDQTNDHTALVKIRPSELVVAERTGR